jgi:hypothetical protein
MNFPRSRRTKLARLTLLHIIILSSVSIQASLKEESGVASEVTEDWSFTSSRMPVFVIDSSA